MADNPKVGDVGIPIRLKAENEDGSPYDISWAETIQCVFKNRTDGTLATKAAEFVTDGTDGEAEYLTEEDDLDAPGIWEVEFHLEGDGLERTYKTQTFRVDARLS